MARYFGQVGYAESTQTSPGVWEDAIIPRNYYGDVTSTTSRWEHGENKNDNLTIQNSISIVADAYAYEHFSAIKYVEWMGQKWKVNSVQVQRPRLVLSIGGVWNGNTPGTTSDSG
jgi:hypothetical protein